MNSMVVSDQAQGQVSASLIKRRINAFQQKCGEYHKVALHFAYHAALPVALNAELLHLVRINFFLDPPEVLPYMVESEFLLSPLCREIDEGLYEIEPEIRDVLLAGLTQTYGIKRIHDIATLLWQYIERQSPWADRIELERAQQLTALNFLNPKKARQWLDSVESNLSQRQSAIHEWHVAMQREIESQARVAPVDLDALLKRFEAGQATEADRLLLRQLLLVQRDEVNKQAVLQTGKYGINVGNGPEIHIGDIIQEAGAELIRAIIQELLAFQKQISDFETKSDKSASTNETVELIEANELIEIEPQLIQQINSGLALIIDLQSSLLLTESQQAKINVIKSKIKALKGRDRVEIQSITQAFQEIAVDIDQLLRYLIQSLAKGLKDLSNSQPQFNNILGIDSSDRILQQVEILEEFRRELEEGQKVAEWLDERRGHLAEVLGQYALNANPFIKETVSSKKIEAFHFTIEQFLESLIHCLTWGNSNVLEASEIPKVFDDEVYSTAFDRLREVIPKRFSTNGIEQLNEYIDCLLENLPFCPTLQI